MGIMIRVLFNNRGWQAACTDPYRDTYCHRCIDPNVNIDPPTVSDDNICNGDCWERYICTKYRWGCTPKGSVFGSNARVGMKVFLVFRQPDGRYTLWGRTTVQDVEKKVREDGGKDEKGFSFIHFDQFEPLPKEKWVMNLTDYQLVGKEWHQGRYRYTDALRDAYLEQLVEKGEVEDEPEVVITATKPTATNLSVRIMPNIDERLEEIAAEEGRQKDEIVREALAEWLRRREL